MMLTLIENLFLVEAFQHCNDDKNNAIVEAVCSGGYPPDSVPCSSAWRMPFQ